MRKNLHLITLKKAHKIVLFICILSCNYCIAQTEFFNSKNTFSEDEFSNFYSSFSVDSTQLYFNANDYYVHVYDKKTGALNWSYYASTKSNDAPKLYQNSVFVGRHISEYENKCVQLNVKTGDTIQTLKIEALNTQPVFRGDLMFCTAISPEIGGAIIAYDLKKNEIVWQKFIAHGVSAQPYYLKDKIIANAEGDNWFELNYNGTLLDTACQSKLTLGEMEICTKNFQYLTHNQKEIPESFIIKHFNGTDVKVKYTDNLTFILGENKILLIGNNNKIKKEIAIDKIITPAENGNNEYKEILKVNESTIWFFVNNTLAIYDFKNNKTLKTFDLAKWDVHQAVLEDDKLWLISKIDGQLHGLNLNEKADSTPLKRIVRYTKSEKISDLNTKLEAGEGQYRTPDGFEHAMFYKKFNFKKGKYGDIVLENFSSNSSTPKNTEDYFERTTYQYFDPANIISIADATTNKTDPLGIIIVTINPGTGRSYQKNQKFIKQNNQKELQWVTETTETESTDEIGIIFLQSDPANFIEIKKSLEELKELYKND